MAFITTGTAARLLGCTEPRLNDLIRRGRIDPPPTIVAGRRVWETHHLIQAAAALDVLTEDVRDRIRSEMRREA